jgi:predicted MFS family arabinose efflux permease
MGTRLTIIAGGLVAAAGLLVTSLAPNIYVVFAAFGIVTGKNHPEFKKCQQQEIFRVVAGAGYSLVFTASTLVILNHFDAQRPLMIALTSVGVGVNTFCYPLLAQWLCEIFEWRGTLLITSALTLHVVAAGFVIQDPIPPKNTLDDVEKKHPLKEEMQMQDDPKSLWRNLDYWILHVNSVMFCFGFSAFFTHLAAFASSHNVEKSMSAMLISAHGIAGLVFRLLLGFLATCQRVDIFGLYVASVVIAAASNFVMTIWTSVPGLFTCVVIHSVSYASYGPLMNEVSYRLIGPKQLPEGFGLLMVSLALGSLIGPPCAGKFRSVG